MSKVQPAEKTYILHGSFIDLTSVIAGAFKNCGQSIINSKDAIIRAWRPFRNAYGIWARAFAFVMCLFPFGLSFTRLLFTAIFTPLICVIITMFQVALVLSLFLIAIAFSTIIIVADWLFCMLYKVVTHCPYCGEKYTLPKYRCECGKFHDNLRPGIYGIFKRKCVCGRKLSTSFLTGRHKHDAWCPACGYDIIDDLTSSYCIPIVGGASCGKTCYISMTMLSLQRNAQRHGLTFAYEKNDLDEYETNVNSYLSKGKRPPKTQNFEQLTYYQFALTPRGAIKQMISLCDVAGELYDIQASGDKITKQKGLKYANAFILLVDPLSVTEYRNEVAKTANIAEYGGSKQPIDEVIDTLLNTLLNLFNIKSKALVNTEVAVVFTKCDIPGLSQIIGNDAVLKYSTGADQQARYKTQNRLCEDFLKRYHEENFLKILKRFKSVQFFTCSALGHPENGQPFVAKNVEEPFYWVLTRINKVIAKAIK